MGIAIPPSQKMMAIPEYRYKKAYIKRAEKYIDENMRGLNHLEFDLVRSMVFPVDKSWPPATHLNKRITEALETLFNNQDLIKYFAKNDGTIRTKLEEWNNFAGLPKAEFYRKVEASGYVTGITMRVIKPFGISYYDFIDFCRLYEKVPVYKCVCNTLIEMKKKKWKGVLTPRVCTFLLSTQKIEETKPSKLKEFRIG